MSDQPPKRGRGRPSKLPKGERKTVRCVVTEAELAEVTAAMGEVGMSQMEFSRACVLHGAREVNAGKPPGHLKPTGDATR